MVTYAQQTDPKKAYQSSIDVTKPIEDQWVGWVPVDNNPVPQPNTNEVANVPNTNTTENKSTQPQTNTDSLTILEKAKQVSTKTWSYYNDVYLPKVQAERARRAGLWDVSAIENPTPSKADWMTPEMIAVDYSRNNISATELENLRLTDPNKYALAKAEIDRSRTLEAINMTWSQYIEGQQKNLDSFLKKWDEIAWDDEGTKLREEVRAKYNIKGTQDSITQYKTELDEIDSRMYKMTLDAGTGSAMWNRWEMIMEQRDLMEQRRIAVQGLNAQIDYLKLWLEQADAVVNDYKEYKGQQLAMMQTEFEMRTGMSQQEFQMKDTNLRDYLTEIDTQLWVIKQDIALEQQAAQDKIANTSLLSLYDDFSDADKVYLAWLPVDTVRDILKKVDETNKMQFDKEIKLMDMWLEQQKFNFEKSKFMSGVKNVQEVNGTIVYSDIMGNVINTYTPWVISNSWLDITQIIDFCTTSRWRENIQCWELVNDYWKMATGAKMWVENTFQSKVQAIQSRWESPTPVAWWVFAYDVGKYGHTGIITDVAEDGTITTLEANIDGTEVWSPPVQKTYKPWQYSWWTFSQAPANNKIIEENAKAMLVGIWGTEWERAEYARMLVERSKQFWWDLKKAKSDLWLITFQDKEFIETRKKDIQNLKDATFGDLMNARRTYDLIKTWNWDGITDTAAIVWFLKTIDPTSVARESEVANVQNSVSVIGALENSLLKAGTGKRLNKEHRQQIADAMTNIIGAADRKYSDAILDYIEEFENNGIDYKNYITTVDMAKVIKSPVTKQDNIKYGVTSEDEYEQWLYQVWPQYDESGYLF